MLRLGSQVSLGCTARAMYGSLGAVEEVGEGEGAAAVGETAEEVGPLTGSLENLAGNGWVPAPDEGLETGTQGYQGYTGTG